MGNNTTPWQKLHEFASVDLAESFALSWQIDGEALLIDIDLFLCSSHPFYERPRPSQGACFRPAEIEFPDCTGLHDCKSKTRILDLSDVAGSIGGGKIFDLQRTGEGRYQISGKFGDIEIIAERPILRLKDIT